MSNVITWIHIGSRLNKNKEKKTTAKNIPNPKIHSKNRKTMTIQYT